MTDTINIADQAPADGGRTSSDPSAPSAALGPVHPESDPPGRVEGGTRGAGVARHARCRSGQPFGGRHPGGCDEPRAEGSRFCVLHRDQLHGAMVGTSPKKPAHLAEAKPGPKPRVTVDDRVAQLVDLLRTRPAMTRGEIAAAMDLSPHSVSRIQRNAIRRGLMDPSPDPKAAAIDAVAAYVAAHPGVSRTDLAQAVGVSTHRISQTVDAGRIVGRQNVGYFPPDTTNNTEQED